MKHLFLFSSEKFPRLICVSPEKSKLPEIVPVAEKIETEKKLGTLLTDVELQNLDQEKIKEISGEFISIVKQKINFDPEVAKNWTPKQLSSNLTKKVDELYGDSAIQDFWEKSPLDQYLQRQGDAGWGKSFGFDKNNLKIGGGAGLIGGMSTEGTPAARLKATLKWGVLATALSHPVILNGVSTAMKAAGETAGIAASVMVPRLVGGLVTGKLFENLKDGKTLYEYARYGKHSADTNREALRDAQADIYSLRESFPLAPPLKEIVDAMESYHLYDELRADHFTEDQLIQKAAEFSVQSEEIRLTDQEFSAMKVQIANDDLKLKTSDRMKFSPAQIRRMLATSAQTEIGLFFTDPARPEISKKFQEAFSDAMLKKERGNLDPLSLAEGNIAEISDADLRKMNDVQKHGVRQFLSMGGTGMALSLTILSFLLVSGVMKFNGVIQKEWWKERKKDGEKIIKFAVKPFLAAVNFAKTKMYKKSIGKYRKATNAFTSEEEKAIWKKMKKADKKKYGEELKALKKKEDKEKDGKFKYSEQPATLKRILEEVRKESAEKKS